MTLESKIKDCKRQENLYQALSLTSHVGLTIFGTGALTTFGMTNPCYFSITGSLLIVGYGPACEVSVDAFQAFADSAAVQCKKYNVILRNLANEKNLARVAELKEYTTLLAQWHALPPIEVIAFNPPRELLTPEVGSETFENFVKFKNDQMENMRNKILRAYLIHVAKNPNDQRELSEFGEFHDWDPSLLYRDTPHAVFENILNTTICENSEADLAQILFTQE